MVFGDCAFASGSDLCHMPSSASGFTCHIYLVKQEYNKGLLTRYRAKQTDWRTTNIFTKNRVIRLVLRLDTDPLTSRLVFHSLKPHFRVLIQPVQAPGPAITHIRAPHLPILLRVLLRLGKLGIHTFLIAESTGAQFSIRGFGVRPPVSS